MISFRLDAPLLAPDLASVPQRARDIAERGFDGTFTFEGPHEPFMPLLLAAEHTSLEIATGVAIAFARTPMTAANLAWDLQHFSKGRFTLGLGSQIRPHVESRYSMPWGKPVSRMREFVQAYHAIFDCWMNGTKLDFRGEFYKHTLMPPMFKPGKLAGPRPKVTLGGVGNNMVECAGEVADGHLVHPFHTLKTLQETTVPALERGLARAGRTRDQLELSAQVLIISGRDEREQKMVGQAVRAQIAFYGSTPAYRHVFEAEGNTELHPELHALSKQGKWMEMAALIDDEMLAKVACIGTPDEVATQLRDRYEGVAQRVAIATPIALSAECETAIVSALRS
ncbi:MAG: TIGR03617 family F420-dependent LLM class oxidoreductase [Myxococcales bacterium]|nr:TIGR03617 family F420-dependent LLM class oxidoreductase [Myxococcales bacterium]